MANLKNPQSTIWDRIYWHFCLKTANIKNSALTKSLIIWPKLMLEQNPLIWVLCYLRGFIFAPFHPIPAKLILRSKEPKAQGQ